MTVSSSKIIIGNPITLPALNATNKIERVFEGACPPVTSVAAVIWPDTIQPALDPTRCDVDALNRRPACPLHR